MIKVIRIENGIRKTVDIQKSIWRNIVNGAELPNGVTYELAPAPKAIELIPEKVETTEENIVSETPEPTVKKHASFKKGK